MPAGKWKGTDVAIKVIEHGDQIHADTNQPLEAFLNQTMSHPNIVSGVHGGILHLLSVNKNKLQIKWMFVLS